MPGDSTPKISGTLSLPQGTAGALHLGACRAEFDDGKIWHVRGDSKTRLCTVFDEQETALGWLEQTEKDVRQVVLPDGTRPPVWFQDKLFSRVVWIGDESFKPVMMLEGRKRVFGDDRIKLEHRDFHSEVRFHCAPGFVVPGVIVAFEVYARPNMGNG